MLSESREPAPAGIVSLELKLAMAAQLHPF
jgi:hypothetical protein